MTGNEPFDALVVGEALIDVVHATGGASEHVGGSPANVALGLGRRGVDVALLTQIGADERGRRIERHVQESGVRVLDASTSLAHTSTASARILPDGTAQYSFDIAWNAFAPVAGARARVVHTGSIATFLEPGASSILELIRRADADEVTFDPNIRPDLVGDRATALRRFDEMVDASTVVKMSDEDAAWLYPGESVDAVIDLLLEAGLRLAVVTLGGDGAILATPGDRVRVAPVPVDVADTIGAGDTFMASLMHSLLALDGRPLDRDALAAMGEDAVRAAAITVARAGADLPWAHEVAAGN